MINTTAVWLIRSVLFLLWIDTTTATYQPVAAAAAAAGGGDGYNVSMNKKCIDKDRHALLDFKALLQDPYDGLSTWGIDDEDDCCEWRGVTCNNQTGHVTELHFSLYFEGELSPSLLNLTKLTYLDLSINSFNGIIPVSFGLLTELTYLDLSENSFNGIIPMSIGSLTKLTYLDLSFNNFSGIIPPEFENLTKLKELSLDNMGRCSVENLDWLSHLSHLKDLEMGGVSLAKANHWVNIVSSLQNLTFLSLEGCNLSQVMHPYSSSSIDSLSSTSSIVILHLDYNNLNSSISHWLFPLTSNSLEQLHLRGNNLDGIPKYLGNLCSLDALYLNGNSAVVNFSYFLQNLNGCTAASLSVLDASSSQFTGSMSYDIQNFLSLQQLSLAHNQLNGISEKVWELPNRRVLNVASKSLSGALSVHFEKPKSDLSSLRYLDLSSCKLGPHFPKWVGTLKNLASLNIASNGISDTIPLDFWEMWPSQLIYLNLSSNNISGKVPDLSSLFYTYANIDLSSNGFYGPVSNVSSSLLSLFLSNNKLYGGISFLCQIVGGDLTYLDLSNNSFSGQLPDCLWHFKSLKVLNLGDNNFTGRLPFSVEYLISLEVLYLYNNRFSGELPLSLRNCTKLVLLDLGVNKFSGYVPVWI